MLWQAAYAEYVATFEDISPEPVEGLRQAQPAFPGGVH